VVRVPGDRNRQSDCDETEVVDAQSAWRNDPVLAQARRLTSDRAAAMSARASERRCPCCRAQLTTVTPRCERCGERLEDTSAPEPAPAPVPLRAIGGALTAALLLAGCVLVLAHGF
jgi:hypothetical protein